MRTKTLLLSAAVGAAGLLAADAQVYSVNSVGYINLTVPAGFSMIANQLASDDSSIGALMPAPVSGTTIFKWNGASFDTYEFIDGLGWFPDGDATLNPGEGAFISNPGPGAQTFTFVGEVPQGSDSNVAVPAGFSIASSAVPQAGQLETDLSFPSAEGDTVFKWNGSTYDTFENISGLGWFPEEPSVAVSEAFFVNKVANAQWDRNFSVNQ